MVGVEEEKPCGDPNRSVSPGNTSSEKMTILIFFFLWELASLTDVPAPLLPNLLMFWLDTSLL